MILAAGDFNSSKVLEIGASDLLRKHGIDVVVDLSRVKKNPQRTEFLAFSGRDISH